MESVATFEKVSLEEYLRSRLEFANRQVLGDERYQEMVDECTREWENIILPSRATAGSAGYDFYLPVHIHVFDDDSGNLNSAICTGIRAKIQPGWVLMIFPRSGLGFKYGVRLKNTVGVIDSDYYNADNEGHIKVKLSADKFFELHAGDRFAQGVFLPYGITTDDAADQERTGGMGSTGV